MDTKQIENKIQTRGTPGEYIHDCGTCCAQALEICFVHGIND
jgi:hypothetical protein